MISVQALYNDLASDLGQGTGSQRFMDAFPRAVNRALDALCVAVDRPTKFPHVNAMSDTIDQFDEHYEYILFAGVKYYLIRAGFKPGDPKTASIVYQDTSREWEEGKADYKMDADNINQSFPQNNVWGLGSVDSSPYP